MVTVTNVGPVPIGTLGPVMVAKDGATSSVDVSDGFSDADNHDLTYEAMSDNTSVATVDG